IQLHSVRISLRSAIQLEQIRIDEIGVRSGSKAAFRQSDDLLPVEARMRTSTVPGIVFASRPAVDSRCGETLARRRAPASSPLEINETSPGARADLVNET
ncbi:hypothetical protein, partial [Bradyrhizobium sp. ORS 285]|uniref:hypothetical protein n=1 Tax=Bradyrhizobium sp. ORS 285 TaxID=115808 RepID=UPI001AEBD808